MLRSLSLLMHRKSWGPFVESAETTGFDHAFTVSWSQGGEDLALLSIFAGELKGTYLDIGAHHPSRFSVTRHLYQRGWTGVNVEANRLLIEKFHEERPRDINLFCAVGQKDEYEFTVFRESAISTINQEWKARFVSEKNEVDRIERVPGRTLRSIYDQFYGDIAVDLLTIDAEGADFEILQSMNFDTLTHARFPRYIQVESDPPISNSLKSPSVNFVMGLGYEPYMVLPYATILKK
jgi:FkbM family methyltransferase